MLIIDKYAYTNKLRDFSSSIKILITLVSIILTRVINDFHVDLIISGIMIWTVIGVGKIPIRNYFKMFFIPMSFLIISLITIMISLNNVNYLYYIQIRNLSVGITRESLNTGIKLFTTVLSSLTSVYFLMLTTPIIDIIKVLKKIKIPNLFIELMVLIYRSIFIFLEEANNIYMAQTMKFGYENGRNSTKSIALLIRNLFVRVLIKHRDMNISLECKLYNGEFKC